jgi:cyclophilin family peptidyl-prolyl cis-trans isomerase
VAAAPAAPQALSNTITPRPAVQLTAEQLDELAGLVAELRTSQGTVVIDFLPEKAPGHVQNFVELARSGFYDGTVFHRVIPGMFIQGGDPTGTGDGGPGYFIAAEFNDEPHVRGTVSMARLRHPDSAGSQFFICLAPLAYLDGGYTAFGHVLSGDEVLDRIEKLGRATPQGTPTETITLEQVLIRPRSPAERPTASRHP